MSNIRKADLAAILDEYEPGCECLWPREDEGECGVIYSLACKIRQVFGIPHTASHMLEVRFAQEESL